MGELSQFDREAIVLLKQCRVFEREDAREIVMGNGVIVIRCPDCDQKADAEGHDRELARLNGGLNRVHPLLHHGGGAVSSPHDVLYPGRDIRGYLLLQIAEAEGIKDIHTVLVEVHAPCGKGADAGLTIVHLIALMMQGKPGIKSVDPSNRVICRVHVDYGDRKRTYFISRGTWLTFWEERGRQLWGDLFQGDPHPNSADFAIEMTPDRTDVLRRLRGIIVDSLGVELDAVQLEASFSGNLAVDSLDAVELVMAIEKAFNIQIPDKDAERIDTVNELFLYVLHMTEKKFRMPALSGRPMEPSRAAMLT